MASDLQSQILEVLFGLQGYFLKGMRSIGKRIYFDVEIEGDHRCSVCNKVLNDCKYDSHIRVIYIGIINNRSAYLRFKQYRLICPDCGVRVELQTISEGKSQYSKTVGSLVINYTQYMSCTAASHLLGIPERTVREIDKKELKKHEKNHIRNVFEIHQVGIDEVAHKKGHNYGTVMTNHLDSKVIWLSQNRTSESLKEIYNLFEIPLESLKVASMDFWRPYFKATQEKFPNVLIVYDLFHLARILNRSIEQERRLYQKSLPDDERKFIKKHTRWILLRRRKNFTEYHEDRLQELKEKNERLYEMYLLKEDFLSIFDRNNDRNSAKVMILEWIENIKKTTFEALKKFARSIIKRLQTILNWFDCPVSNGKSEGVNNLIKTLLKRGYGYKDFEYFRLKVLQKCGYLMVNLDL